MHSYIWYRRACKGKKRKKCESSYLEKVKNKNKNKNKNNNEYDEENMN